MSVGQIAGVDSFAVPDQRKPAGPWQRYWARYLDLIFAAIMSIALIIPMIFLVPAFTDLLFHSGLILILIYTPVLLLIDAAVQAAFGNTLGKKLLGIRIEAPSGSRVPPRLIFRRSLLLYVRGIACGIPILFLVTMANAFRRVNGGRKASWDDDLGLAVYDNHGSLLRSALAGLFVTAFTLWSFFG